MRVLLCALTGLGNDVLEALTAAPQVTDVAVATRAESGAFPYYECENLAALCRRGDVTVHEELDMASPEAARLVRDFAPDVILAATFHQKIPAAVRGVARLGAVNVHPSLLPAYRGPTPTHWAILEGEAETGVTFHELTDAYDAGDILMQERLALEESTDGQLRRRLAALAGEMTGPFLQRLSAGRWKPRPQDETRSSTYPALTSPAGLRLLRTGGYPPDRIRRALTPYPGPQAVGGE